MQQKWKIDSVIDVEISSPFKKPNLVYFWFLTAEALNSVVYSLYLYSML